MIFGWSKLPRGNHLKMTAILSMRVQISVYFESVISHQNAGEVVWAINHFETSSIKKRWEKDALENLKKHHMGLEPEFWQRLDYWHSRNLIAIFRFLFKEKLKILFRFFLNYLDSSWNTKYAAKLDMSKRL